MPNVALLQQTGKHGPRLTPKPKAPHYLAQNNWIELLNAYSHARAPVHHMGPHRRARAAACPGGRLVKGDVRAVLAASGPWDAIAAAAAFGALIRGWEDVASGTVECRRSCHNGSVGLSEVSNF